MRVVQRTHPVSVPSKLNPKYSDLCEVLEIRGPALTLRELDSHKVLTANHDSVCRSSLSQPDAQFPAVPADLRLFAISFSRPESGSRDFLDADAPDNPEIEDSGNTIIQSMSMSLPDAGLNLEFFRCSTCSTRRQLQCCRSRIHFECAPRAAHAHSCRCVPVRMQKFHCC